MANNEDRGIRHSIELDAVMDRIEATYWVPGIETPFASLEDLCEHARSGCPPIVEPLSSFLVNLRSAIALVEFPILALAPGAIKGTDIHDRLLATLGDDNWGENPKDREFAYELVSHVLKAFGNTFASKPEAARLMHQACLLTWGALEIYCKDVLIYSLNAIPKLYLNLQQVPSLKKRFSISQERWLPLLEAHGFNLNGCLGHVVASDKDLSSPQLLRDVFRVLFNGVSDTDENGLKLLECFAEDALWKLGQRRHVVAHKCGIVDATYMQQTNDALQVVGSPLRLRGRDVAEGISIAARCAIALSYWVSKCSKASSQQLDL